jgi:formylglycine-generating enzyme required for sulfatase activity
MVSVEGGSFELGSSPSDDMRGFGELRAQQRRVKTFCIDIYEYPNQRGKAPRVGVSWTSAKRACERAGKRLCAEAEWEKACKGPGGKRFPFGNRYSPDACNISEGSGADRKPGPCGAFPRCRSGYGVADLAGNVREWTASQFQKGVSDKVVKGGAADDGAYMARCAARLNEAASARQPMGSNSGLAPNSSAKRFRAAKDHWVSGRQPSGCREWPMMAAERPDEPLPSVFISSRQTSVQPNVARW